MQSTGYDNGMVRYWIVALAVLSAGCSQNQPPQKSGPEPAKPVSFFHVDPATAATLGGKVTFQGVKPAREVISMTSDAGCVKAHGGKPVYDESVLAGKGGTLANAFVYIKSGLEGKTFEPVQSAVQLDQHGCMFVPRIIALRNGQTLDVKNSDSVSHNIHPVPANNREFSEQQSPDAPDIQHRFPRAEVMIPVKCNVHSWMRAYIGVVEHPYFAVTGEDGSYSWENVPPGDYTVAVWHEKLGEQTMQVHVAASQHASADFTYK
jgi:plastocyanin